MLTHLDIFNSNTLKVCGTNSLSVLFDSPCKLDLRVSIPERASPIEIKSTTDKGVTPLMERHLERA